MTQTKQFDNTNRGSLWLRADGCKANPAEERCAPIASGTINVNGVNYDLSLWTSSRLDGTDPDVVELIRQFRLAMIQLDAEINGSNILGVEPDANGKMPSRKPLFSLSINKREDRQAPKQSAQALSELF